MEEEAIIQNDKRRPLALCGHMRKITVEPIFVLYALAVMALYSLQDQYVYYRMTLKYNLSSYEEANITAAEDCKAEETVNNSYFIVQQAAQAESSQFLFYLSIANGLPGLFSVIFYGTYSDKIGRKVPILLALGGGAIHVILLLFTQFFELPLYMLIIGCAVDGFLGGISSVLMSCFSYIADISTHKQRTIRIAICEALFGVAGAMGQISCGYLIKGCGFFWPTGIILGLHITDILYSSLILKEPIKLITKPSTEKSLADVLRAFQLYLKTPKEDPQKPSKLRMCFFAYQIAELVVIGKYSIQTLYLLNYPLCWNSVLIGIYGAVFLVITNAGTLLLSFLAQKRIGDVGVALIGALSSSGAMLFTAFATTTFLVFMVPIVGFGSMAVIPMMRSIMSKNAGPDEQGALFSTLAATDGTFRLLASLIFNSIYANTLFFMKGFVYIVMAGIQMVGVVLLIIYGLRFRKKNETQTYSVQVNE